MRPGVTPEWYGYRSRYCASALGIRYPITRTLPVFPCVPYPYVEFEDDCFSVDWYDNSPRWNWSFAHAGATYSTLSKR